MLGVGMVRRLPDVFGVSREIPLTYRERSYVDGKFLSSLARDKHLVVFGGSKQGKTCLRKHALKPEDYIVVQCGNGTTTPQLYASILKEAGATVDVTEKHTTRGDQKLRVEFNVLGVNLGGDAGRSSDKSSEKKHLEIDPADPNDVGRILGQMSFQGFIVLEDFHYLSEDVQRQVAMDLKAFHEKSTLCFIVVGVWLESNRLVLYNGDLAGRLIPIEADRWEAEDLNAIIDAGEPLLNVHFPPDVRAEILRASQGNVGILQEACYRLCDRQGVTTTQEATVDVGSKGEVQKIVSELANEQAGRYQNFLTQFVDGFQKTELEMYKWLMVVIISCKTSELKKGLKTSDILARMQELHPKGDRLLYNNVLQALKNVGKVQHKHKVQPVILDFDVNENELRVVDGGFTLFLAATDINALRDLVGVKYE